MLCALPNFLAKGTGFFSSHASINNNNDNNNSKDVVDINTAKDLEIPDQDEIKSVSSRNSLNFFKRVSRTVSIRNNSNFFKLKFNSLTLPIPLSTCVGLGIEDRVDSMIEAEVRRPKHKRRHLPEASGPYTVGCVDLMLGLADHGTFFRLYYPTNATNVQANYKIWPLWLPRKQYAHGYVYFLKKNKIFGRIANLVGGEVYVPVLWQAPLIKNNEKFPVVIVSHGIGGNRTTLSTYCNELASHGFVVAALEHRDGSASMTLCLTEQLDSSIRDVDEQVHIERHCHSDSDIHSQEDNFDTRVQSAVQFYLDEGTENRESAGGRGSRVRQRRENRRRSVRHNNSCTEEWRRFQHVPVWDDFDLRNGQMYHRADEISDLLNQLISMNEGKHINNILGFGFNTTQFKDRLDISKVAVIGHSFGGASTVATLATDVRFKVGISLDGWFHAVDNWAYKTAKQPCLLLNMEQFQWERNVNQMITFQNANPDADRPMITLKGGCHQSMTDFQFIVPHMLGRLMDVCHTLAPAQAMSTCIEASLAFLHKHLDLPFEQQHQDILDGNHKHLMAGTNVDLTIPDDGPTPP